MLKHKRTDQPDIAAHEPSWKITEVPYMDLETQKRKMRIIFRKQKDWEFL
jgi:hypothetical protein